MKEWKQTMVRTNFPMRASTLGLVVAVVAGLSGTAANAAFLSGDFSVRAINVTNLNSSQSQATESNFDAAELGVTNSPGALGNGNETFEADDFTYSGSLDFRVPGPQGANQTIVDWLNTGNGSVTGLDGGFGGLQLSTADINNGTATSTFFLFKLDTPLGPTNFSVTHDDGVALFDDGSFIGGDPGPTSETTTVVPGFDGGDFSLIYVASNGNPSILEVDVPLPATMPMLLGALGALGVAGAAARRRKAI
jgi:hypothetical protein